MMIKTIVSICCLMFYTQACAQQHGDNNKDTHTMQEQQDIKTTKKILIREPVVAGMFYPGEQDKLRVQVAELLKNARKAEDNRKPFVLIVPHAGYKYSGSIAAIAYKQLIGHQYDSIIIIGQSHHAYFDGICVYKDGFFKTPLGMVEIDTELAELLIQAHPQIKFIPNVDTHEHSIEVQLPFLQYIFGNNMKFVPVLLSSIGDCKILSDALVKYIRGKDVLIVISSDMSHYHPYQEACNIDRATLSYIEDMDIQGTLEQIKKYHSIGRCAWCAPGAVLTSMFLAEKIGIDDVVVLEYANSGDTAGGKNRVVGYCAVAMYKKITQVVIPKPMEQKLLKIARETLESYVKHRKVPEFKVTEPELLIPRGVFVSLKKDGKLRGCIGFIQPRLSLYQAVIKMTIAAATEDRRFFPVTEEELKDIKIEITILSELKLIDKPEEIVVGEHGIYIVKGLRSGLLLPQVAVEYNWNREEFLQNVCYKANLPPHAWKDKDTKIYVFTGRVFGE